MPQVFPELSDREREILIADRGQAIIRAKEAGLG
jgi:hypothetical protein